MLQSAAYHYQVLHQRGISRYTICKKMPKEDNNTFGSGLYTVSQLHLIFVVGLSLIKYGVLVILVLADINHPPEKRKRENDFIVRE